MNNAEYIVEGGQQLLFETAEGVELLLRNRYRNVYGSAAWVLGIARKGNGIVAVLGDNEFAVTSPARPDVYTPQGASIHGQINYMRELLAYLSDLRLQEND